MYPEALFIVMIKVPSVSSSHLQVDAVWTVS